MKLSLGNPVTGSNYFHRPLVVQKLRRALRRGHVVFLGPRRTGKTSILLHLRDQPEAGTAVLHLNLEKYDTPAAWLEDMIGKLEALLAAPPAAWGWVKEKTAAVNKFLKRIQGVKGPGFEFKLNPEAAKDWQPVAKGILELLVEAEMPVLILLDEFPWFLSHVAAKSGKEDVNALLGWFRDARSALADRPARFLVTGSIGLHGLVRKLGLTKAVNDLDTVEITPLDDADAMRFLEAVTEGEDVRLTQLGRRRVLELLGGNLPYLLQLFVSEIQDWQGTDGNGKAPTRTELQRLYSEKLAHGSRNKYCSEMWDRLREIFTIPERHLANALLRALCSGDAGLTRERCGVLLTEARVRHGDLTEDDLENVLDTLQHDGYILRLGDGPPAWRFSSHILRDYWNRKPVV